MRKRLLFTFLSVYFLNINTNYAQAFNSNLPIIRITTPTTIVDAVKVNGTMEIVNNIGRLNNSLDPATEKHLIGIEYRGSTSQDISLKKPFSIETRNEKGENLNTSVLGLPAENDWTLIAPYSDKSLIRDHLIYTIARKMNRYASKTVFVEVIVNGVYHGVCFLGEKIKQGKNRVDIAKLKTTDISGDELTGGYILKIDKGTGGLSKGWNSEYLSFNKYTNFLIEYPKIEDLKNEQFNYIKKYVNDFEKRLQSDEYKDPEKGYRKLVDVDSFVDFFLLNELTKNVDGYRLSTYFHKDKDSKNGKLTMGPIWDFNLAFGNADYCEGGKFTGWGYKFNDYCGNDSKLVPFWWDTLVTDEFYATKLKSRWKILREGVLSNQNINNQIDSATNVLKEAQVRNFVKWPILGRYVWPNNFVAKTYEEEINYAKTWINSRLAWLDNTNILNSNLLTNEQIIEDNEKPFIYPNPIIEKAKVSFANPKKQFVKGTIKSINGATLKTIVQQELEPGEYEYEINKENLAPGLYFFNLEKSKQPTNIQKFIVN
jgi:hypothetical protein